jgi:arabinofuranosyltransferase
MVLDFTRNEKAGLILLFACVTILTYYGWQLFWFLTDDAYIAFRYISNSNLGFGYVWNPPPFKPVEGYTSFLWIVLLDIIWSITGVEPPDSANYLSLFFSALTLLAGSVLILAIDWNSRLRKYRVLFLACALIGVVTNRTFLAWTSSGLETAMFNFFFIAWLYFCFSSNRTGTLRLLGLCSVTALLCLTRPDGLLFAFSTLVIVVLALYEDYRGRTLRLRDFMALLPLVAIPAHLLGRRLCYGAWLPNTYYAKTVSGALWFESGARYFISFVLEYALWVWIVLLMFAAATKTGILRTACARQSLSMDSGRITKSLAVLTVIGHIAYYTVVIGGDHFEFRVYSHLIPVLFISFVWMLNRVACRAVPAGLLLVVFILLSWIVPWTHWYETHSLATREQTRFMRVSVTGAIHKTVPAVPDFIVGYFKTFDRLQFWLISHAVCMRHQEHKIFHAWNIATLPARAAGESLSGDGFPVLPAVSVGVISWVLPKVCIIDLLGLNDYVIARTPTGGRGLMAHDRQPPPGYIECFSPNVVLRGKEVVIQQREQPLTAETIAACEERFRSPESKSRASLKSQQD